MLRSSDGIVDDADGGWAEAAPLTRFVLDVFRVNNLALAWGDRLVAPLGLTSARWQVLGAIAAVAEQPQPVAWLARDLGAYRQNVQRIVNDLARDGLVETRPNPHHRRAHLIVLTDRGHDTYAAAIAVYAAHLGRLTARLPEGQIAAAQAFLTALRSGLEAENDVSSPA